MLRCSFRVKVQYPVSPGSLGQLVLKSIHPCSIYVCMYPVDGVRHECVTSTNVYIHHHILPMKNGENRPPTTRTATNKERKRCGGIKNITSIHLLGMIACMRDRVRGVRAERHQGRNVRSSCSRRRVPSRRWLAAPCPLYTSSDLPE